MSPDDFNEILTRRLDRIQTTLGAKRAEYMTGGDAFSNFKRAAEFQRIRPEQAAWNFLMKHLVSIQDMVESGTIYSTAQWDEKIGDAVNYLILIEGMVAERKDALFEG